MVDILESAILALFALVLVAAAAYIISSIVDNRKFEKSVRDALDRIENPVHFADGCYCRECRFRIYETVPGYEDAGGIGACGLSGLPRRLNDFCSRGIKEDDDDVTEEVKS